MLCGDTVLLLQVDTFETVKNNVYNMLGELAQDFNAEQLDVLFKKFEACAGWPVPDAMKIMDLMRRLAKSDTKVACWHVWVWQCIWFPSRQSTCGLP